MFKCNLSPNMLKKSNRNSLWRAKNNNSLIRTHIKKDNWAKLQSHNVQLHTGGDTNKAKVWRQGNYFVLEPYQMIFHPILMIKAHLEKNKK